MTQVIKVQDMIEAISRSGYLIEQRVEEVLVGKGYAVETNVAYLDNDSRKNREVDLTAINGKAIIHGENHFIFPYLVIECENNHQPIVFFRSKPRPAILSLEAIKVSGLPISIYDGKHAEPIPVTTILEADRYHHYCTGSYCTQYCSFTGGKDKRPWMASHLDEQHDTFVSLIKSLEYFVSDHYAGYSLPMPGKKEHLNLQFYYPLVILQDELYEAYEEEGEVKMEPKEHIQFRKQTVQPEVSRSFHIDVIRERFLSTFLQIIDKEMEQVYHTLRHKWSIIEDSIEINVQRLRETPRP